MNILQGLEDRRKTAEEKIEMFRQHSELFDQFRRIAEAETQLRCVRVLTKAPLTMNPNKINAHFSMVVSYLEEINGRGLAAESEEFMKNLSVTTVNSYSVALSKWVNTVLDAKKFTDLI